MRSSFLGGQEIFLVKEKHSPDLLAFQVTSAVESDRRYTDAAGDSGVLTR